ncbi:MAG: metallophosphoesterase [Magnetococcales bacterium]|nr:metallophosphoesterase [Magnetococcales bacterium]
MTVTYMHYLASRAREPKPLVQSVWTKINRGIQTTIQQYQSRVSHPVFSEVRKVKAKPVAVDVPKAKPVVVEVPKAELVAVVVPKAKPVAVEVRKAEPVAVEVPKIVKPKSKPLPEWSLVISDTDNDIDTTIYALWLTGLCDIDGNWYQEVPCLEVVHTGDWLNKWRPSHKAVEFFKSLKETAPKQCPVVLLNGNHELSILKMADDGITTKLSDDDLDFIRNQEIIHITSDNLFVHGYPNLSLVNILLQMKREELALSAFSKRLRQVFYSKNRPLYCEQHGMDIIGDLRKPKYYYEKRAKNSKINQGQEIASRLQSLGINSVVHGHKPNNNTQVDQELAKQLPGIRLVNNDNRIKNTGLGGMLINRSGEMVFLNPKTMKEAGGEKAFRKQLKKLLKTRRKDMGLPSNKQINKKPKLELVA